MSKIIKVSILTVIIVFCISTTIFAINVSDYKPEKPEGYSEFTEIGGGAVGVLQYVGITFAVVILALLGIKYMFGSIEKKAEYKKSMMPYVVGCAFIICSSIFVRLIYLTVDEWTEADEAEKNSKENIGCFFKD